MLLNFSEHATELRLVATERLFDCPYN